MRRIDEQSRKTSESNSGNYCGWYQLDSEAFQFLSQNVDTANPVDIMDLALQRIADLQEKPFFIDKVFLETLIQQLKVPSSS